MFRRILFNLSFCLLASVAVSQNVKYFYKIAEEQFYGENHEEALYYYREASKKNANYEDLKYKIEMCLLLTGNQDRSLDRILAYRDSYGKEDKFYYYFLGKILDYRYQFDEAIAAWNQFLKLDAYKSKEIIEETNTFIAESQRKKDFMATFGDYVVTPVEGRINSSQPQFSPVFLPGTNEFLMMSVDNSPDELTSMYRIKKLEDAWAPPSSVKNLKSFQSSLDNFGVADDGQEIYTFRDKVFWVSRRNGDSWSAPEEWENDPGKMKSLYHFFFTNDGNRIIYSSDENYKKRGFDLYEISKEQNEKWTKPSLLAGEVNTELNERNAFLTADGNTLYFSSNGHNSIGGYDIFKSTYNAQNNSWSKPENMGYPINTPDDEIDFYLSPDNKFGFLSSNRQKSTYDYDIHYFYKAEQIQLKGTTYDLVTKNELGGLSIEFLANNISKKKFETETDGSGSYSTKVYTGTTYQVTISEGSEVIYSEVFAVPETASDSFVKDFQIDRFNLLAGEEQPSSTEVPAAGTESAAVAVSGPSVIEKIAQDDPGRYKQYEKDATELSSLGSKYRTARKAILDNIYFDFGTAQLRRESLMVLDELWFTLNYYPNLKIIIAGHTDSTGPADANQWLSENRAKAVKDFLVSLEIAEDRIETIGLGDTEPLATNDHEKDGRELNRRIEVLVKE